MSKDDPKAQRQPRVELPNMERIQQELASAKRIDDGTAELNR